MLFKFPFTNFFFSGWKTSRKLSTCFVTAVSNSLIVYRLLLSNTFLFCPLLSYSLVYAYSRLSSTDHSLEDGTIFCHLPPVQSHFIFIFHKFVNSKMFRNYASINSKTMPLFLWNSSNATFVLFLIYLQLHSEGKVKTFEGMATFFAWIPSDE